MIPLSLHSFLSIKILFGRNSSYKSSCKNFIRHFSSHLLLFRFLNLLAYFYSKIESQKYISFFLLLFFFFCFSSTSLPILIDPHQSYVFIVEVAVNLWSPHYCRFFSLSLSLSLEFVSRAHLGHRRYQPPSVVSSLQIFLSLEDFPPVWKASTVFFFSFFVFYNGSARARSNESRGITNEPTDREKKR